MPEENDLRSPVNVVGVTAYEAPQPTLQADLLPYLSESRLLPALARFELALRERPVSAVARAVDHRELFASGRIPPNQAARRLHYIALIEIACHLHFPVVLVLDFDHTLQRTINADLRASDKL